MSNTSEQPEKKLGSKSEMEAAAKAEAEKPSAMRQFQTLIQAVWPGAGGTLTLEEVIRKAVEHRQGYAFANEQLSMVTKAVTGGPLNTKQAMNTAARWREAEARGAAPPPESTQELKRENERFKNQERFANAVFTALQAGKRPEDDGTRLTAEILTLWDRANRPVHLDATSKCPANGIIEMPGGKNVCVFDLMEKVEVFERDMKGIRDLVGLPVEATTDQVAHAVTLAVEHWQQTSGSDDSIPQVIRTIGENVGAPPEATPDEVIGFVKKLAAHAIAQNQKLILLEAWQDQRKEIIELHFGGEKLSYEPNVAEIFRTMRQLSDENVSAHRALLASHQELIHGDEQKTLRIKALEDEITKWRTGSEESAGLIESLNREASDLRNTKQAAEEALENALKETAALKDRLAELDKPAVEKRQGGRR